MTQTLLKEVLKGKETSPSSIVNLPRYLKHLAADDDCSSPTAAVITKIDINLPPSPPKRRRRCESLEETKLLYTTRAIRSDSEFLFSENFFFSDVIGQGSFSQVYRAQHISHGTTYAIKKTMRPFRGKRDRSLYLREIECVSSLPEHDNIVKYYRGWQEHGYGYTLMEYCSNGSLLEYVGSLGRPLTETEIWSFVKQIASGLDFIHQHGVLHLDIKPANIFVDDHGLLKIGDFGLAVQSMACPAPEEGDCRYLAPELLQDDIATPAVDMFSLGICLYQWVVDHCPPGSGEEWHALRTDRADFSSPAADALPPRSMALLGLTRMLLSRNPGCRPSASSVLAEADRQLALLLEAGATDPREDIAAAMEMETTPFFAVEPSCSSPRVELDAMETCESLSDASHMMFEPDDLA